jgi:soluble lytic murein transglycosylase-like protein
MGRAPRSPRSLRDERGQAAVLLVGVMVFVLLGAYVLGALAQVSSGRDSDQQAADLGALAAAKRMRAVYPRVYEPPTISGHPNRNALSRAAYLSLGSSTAVGAARANGAAGAVTVRFPGAAHQIAPTEVSVRVGDATAAAELVPDATGPLTGIGGQDQYNGPFAYRQGKPMRPDVAPAFDRLAEAARREAGITVLVVSGWRSNAEQAVLFAAHPDPKWVAPPGQSLHRFGTELDLGPPSAYAWLDANAGRFHFSQRYSWEPWHLGYLLNPSSTPSRGDGHASATLPSFVPEAYVPDIVRASEHWSVSAILLAAQIAQESGFNPNAVSPAGAQGIAQFMPGTAASYGLRNPFDAAQAIDAQAHLMRDLLRQFGSDALALAAYNAGPGPVAACGCVPPIPETVAYVAAILGRLNGAGDPQGLGMTIRLVR